MSTTLDPVTRAAMLDHACNAYCRDGRHALLVNGKPDPARSEELARVLCSELGVAFVALAPAEVPLFRIATMVGRTERRGLALHMPLPADATIYLLTYREGV